MTTAQALTAWYLYGVVDAGDLDVGTEARLVTEGPLAAVVTAVPLSEYGEEELAERLNDRVWLEQHALAHQRTLERVAAATAVVPFRFGAIYRELESVRALLRDRHRELVAALERVRGRVEIGVKAWAEPDRLAAALAGATADGSSGRGYLEHRLKEQQQARTAAARLSEIAHVAHARLIACAVDGVANRPQPPELSGREETMILNAAYLVDGGGDGLAAEASRLQAMHRDDGVTFEVTGPWPPYNFVDVRETS
ncbi:MAG: GvpL/GvpF family gas vesicle protein [Gaiellaceae bacterium]